MCTPGGALGTGASHPIQSPSPPFYTRGFMSSGPRPAHLGAPAPLKSHPFIPNCWAGALGPLDLGWLAETMWMCPGLREATQGRGAPHMASGFDLGLKQVSSQPQPCSLDQDPGF